MLLGCWTIDNSYIICNKDNKYYAAYIDKEKSKISDLKLLEKGIKNGDTIFFEQNNPHNEYMIIKDNGLYIYDETSESGTDATIWSNDSSWNK